MGVRFKPQVVSLIHQLTVVLLISGTLTTRVRSSGFLEIGNSRALLLRHQVEVKIVDQIAITRIRQTFLNPTDQAREGTYRFALSPATSVSDFAIREGETRVAGIIERRDVESGDHGGTAGEPAEASSVEESDSNRFQARVYQIAPHGEKTIEIELRELLPVNEGIVEYRCPLASLGNASHPVGTLLVNIQILDGARIQSAWSSHSSMAIHHHSAHRVDARIEILNVTPTSDLRLQYRLEPITVGGKVRVHRSDTDAGFLLLSLNPEDPGFSKRRKDVVFALDVSGSMAGQRLEHAKRALASCLNQLEPGDRFEIFTFADRTGRFGETLQSANLIEVGAHQIDAAIQWIDALRADGNSDIESALRMGLQAFDTIARTRPRYMLILSDGEPTAGVTGNQEIRDSVRIANQRSARLFTFGLGEAAGSSLLRDISHENRGEKLDIRSSEDLERELPLFFRRLTRPLIDQVEIDWGDLSIKNPLPAKVLPFYLGRQVAVVARYTRAGQGFIKIRARAEGRPISLAIPVDLPEAELENEQITRLWARRFVGARLESEPVESLTSDVRDEIVALSMKYVFPTPFTYFQAVRERKRAILPESLRDQLERPAFASSRSTPDKLKYGFQIDLDKIADPASDANHIKRTSMSDSHLTNEGQGLVRLTASYTDKLSRMTSDEREKLKASVEKFVEPPGDLSEEQKLYLTSNPTDPSAKDEFNRRLHQLRNWIEQHRHRGVLLVKFRERDQVIQKMYGTNRIQAGRLLDESFAEMQRIDGFFTSELMIRGEENWETPPPTEAGTSVESADAGASQDLATIPGNLSIPAGRYASPTALWPDVDHEFYRFETKVDQLRRHIRRIRGRLDTLIAIENRNPVEKLPPAIDGMTIAPALTRGGKQVLIGLTLRYPEGQRPRIRWSCKRGRFLYCEDGAAVWQAPSTPGDHEIEVILYPEQGDPVNERIEIHVYQPGQITFAPEMLRFPLQTR